MFGSAACVASWGPPRGDSGRIKTCQGIGYLLDVDPPRDDVGPIPDTVGEAEDAIELIG
jgi:hypothetical protein